MSLMVSSTTDSQESVNLAAGLAADAPSDAPPAEDTVITEPEAAKPKEAPVKPEPEPDEPEEGEEEKEKPEPEEDDKAKPPARKGRYERRIDRLEQQLAYERKIRELTEQLQGPPREQRAAQPPAPAERPHQEAFQSYEEYIEALTDWKADQAFAKAEQKRQAATAQEQAQQQAATWRSRVEQARAKHEDFDDVLAGTEHIILSKPLQDAIATSEDGAMLSYELAKQPQELERIASLPPLAAIRALGAFEAKITATSNGKAPTQRPAVSRAPEPIEPVTRGGPMSTKPYDQLPYQEFKRRRERDIAAAKAR